MTKAAPSHDNAIMRKNNTFLVFFTAMRKIASEFHASKMIPITPALTAMDISFNHNTALQQTR